MMKKITAWTILLVFAFMIGCSKRHGEPTANIPSSIDPIAQEIKNNYENLQNDPAYQEAIKKADINQLESIGNQLNASSSDGMTGYAMLYALNESLKNGEYINYPEFEADYLKAINLIDNSLQSADSNFQNYDSIMKNSGLGAVMDKHYPNLMKNNTSEYHPITQNKINLLSNFGLSKEEVISAQSNPNYQYVINQSFSENLEAQKNNIVYAKNEFAAMKNELINNSLAYFNAKNISFLPPLQIEDAAATKGLGSFLKKCLRAVAKVVISVVNGIPIIGKPIAAISSLAFTVVEGCITINVVSCLANAILATYNFVIDLFSVVRYDKRISAAIGGPGAEYPIFGSDRLVVGYISYLNNKWYLDLNGETLLIQNPEPIGLNNIQNIQNRPSKKALCSLVIQLTILQEQINYLNGTGYLLTIKSIQKVLDDPESQPTIFRTIPPQGDTSAGYNTDIQIEFTAQINFSTVNSSNFIVKDSLNIPVAGTYSYDSNLKILTFKPASELGQSTQFQVSLLDTIKGTNGMPLKTSANWTFQTGTFPAKVEKVVFNPETGIPPVDVNIFSPTVDTSIRYTIDGSIPNCSDPKGMLYQGQVSISADNTTLKAIACRTGWTSLESDIKTITYQKVLPKPIISPLGGTYKGAQMITMTSLNIGEEVRYTIDNNSPSCATSTLYKGPFSLEGSATIKAIACKTGWGSSLISQETYNIQWLGTKQFGGTLSEGALSMTTDNENNVIITGYTSGNLDGISNNGSYDAFISKYGPSGNRLWTKLIGTSAYDAAVAIKTDSAGNIYIAGSTVGNIGGTGNAGGNDIFIAKFEKNGNPIWLKQFGSTGNDMATSLALDKAGNILIAGYTNGALDGNLNTGANDAFVIKFDSAGSKIWTKQLGSINDDQAFGVAADTNNNVYITGFVSESLEGNTKYGLKDVFAAKFDAAGNKIWSKQFGSMNDDAASALAIDNTGNLYITGYSSGDFDGNTLNGDYDLLLLKLDSAGNKIFSQLFGSSSYDVANALEIDSANNLYITGITKGIIDGIGNNGEYDVLFLKFDANGNKIWSKIQGSYAYDNGTAITLDNTGNIFISGSTGGGLDGNYNIGGNDIFITKYDSTGTKQ